MTLANINLSVHTFNILVDAFCKEVKEAKNLLSFDDERSYLYVYKEYDLREPMHGHVDL
jgi:hypothetical protein